MIATSSPVVQGMRDDWEAKRLKNCKVKKTLFVNSDSDDDISIRDIFSESENESENECEQVSLGEVTGVNVGDYVLIEFDTKSMKVFYVGCVLSEKDEDGDYEVEYLRKKHVKDSARGTIFVKASTEDISSVPAKQIRALLPPPSMSGTTKRTQSNIVFGVNFGNLQLR